MKAPEKEQHTKDIEIESWRFSPVYGITTSPQGKKLILEPRLSKLLYLLSLHANEIVSRRYLIENIWPDTVVSGESLTRAVADLRKILSMNYSNAIEIETIPRRGYKLVLQTGPRVYALKLKINHPIRYTVFGIVFFLLTLLWFLT